MVTEVEGKQHATSLATQPTSMWDHAFPKIDDDFINEFDNYNDTDYDDYDYYDDNDDVDDDSDDEDDDDDCDDLFEIFGAPLLMPDVAEEIKKRERKKKKRNKKR